MGRLHAKAIVDSELAALAAVVDVDPEARRLADAHGARYHASIEDLLDADDIDGFVVCLPDRAHVEAACALLEAGHAVLLEKPMADTLEGALQIAEASRRGNARLLVAHILRFDPRYAQAAAAVAEGQLGDVVHLSSGRLGVRDIGRRLGGSSSVLFYLGVHDVDLIQWISGKRIVRVSSIAASKLMPSLGVDSEDVIVTNAELEDGVVAQLYAGWTLRSDTPSPSTLARRSWAARARSRLMSVTTACASTPARDWSSRTPCTGPRCTGERRATWPSSCATSWCPSRGASPSRWIWRMR